MVERQPQIKMWHTVENKEVVRDSIKRAIKWAMDCAAHWGPNTDEIVMVSKDWEVVYNDKVPAGHIPEAVVKGDCILIARIRGYANIFEYDIEMDAEGDK